MAFIGNIIKTTIGAMDKLTIDVKTNREKQIEQLNDLLVKAKDTSFGKYYNFTSILNAEDIITEYKLRVPIFDYHKMNQQWWNQQRQNPDITWPGKPNYFARSSGTTGKKSKKIPVTDDYISSVRDVGISMIKSLTNFDFPPELYEKEVLMLSSSSDLSTDQQGFEEGEISGINVSNFPDWYDVFYRPGQEIAAINDWDKRLEKIVEEAPNWDIGSIAGIPSWVLEMLKAIIKKHSLKNIHEIWPNFQVYSSGGVAFETYRAAFEKICGKPITIMDTYLASEGFFAYTSRPGTMDMKLAIEHGVYYEFIPFNEKGFDETGNLLEDPLTLSIDEVDEGEEYALLVTTCSGAWRYLVGDTIKFTDIENTEIILTGRTKFFLNVVGSQLSEEKLDDAILTLSKAHNVDVNEYIVGAQKQKEEYIHQWILITDSNINTKAWKEGLDEHLKKANKNYKVARTKALSDIDVKVINKNTYHSYLENEKKKGGQIKTPKVMPEEKLKKFIDFIEK